MTYIIYIFQQYRLYRIANIQFKYELYLEDQGSMENNSDHSA